MMTIRFRVFLASVAVSFSVAAAPAAAQVDPATLPADHPEAVVEFAGPEALFLDTPTGRHELQVEVAATPRARERGMMFRDALGPDEGMLFFYDQPQIGSVWMKNTLIPLDILFIRPDGAVAKIVRNAVPGSLAPMRSGVPVAAFLEIPGGRAAELGVEPGSTVHHLVFGNIDE